MWEWLSWRLGTPTVPMVARVAKQAAAARGGSEIVADLANDELRFHLEGRPCATSLPALHAAVLRAPRAGRRAVVEGIVAAIVPTADPAGDPPVDPPRSSGYAQVRSHLLPVVRTAAEEAIDLLGRHRLAAEASAEGTVTSVATVDALSPASSASTSSGRIATAPAARVAQPLVSGLIAGLALEASGALRRLTVDELGAWGVTPGQAFDDALENLRARPGHDVWNDLGGGLWRAERDDAHASSRLLLPHLIRHLGLLEPVALVPVRHALLVASGRDEAALAAMAAHAKTLMGEEPRWLSVEPLWLTDDGWRVFDPPPALRDAFDELRCLDQASTYATQQPLIDALNERQGVDVHVAKVMLVQGKDDGKLTTCAVWSEGVDTLLPRSNLVMLRRADQGEQLLVPWDTLWPSVGHLLVATDHLPPRYLARQFPDAGEWARLQAVIQGAMAPA